MNTKKFKYDDSLCSSEQIIQITDEQLIKAVRHGIFDEFDHAGIRYIKSTTYGSEQITRIQIPVQRFIWNLQDITSSILESINHSLLSKIVGESIWCVLVNKMHEQYIFDKKTDKNQKIDRIDKIAIAFSEIPSLFCLYKKSDMGYSINNKCDVDLILDIKFGFIEKDHHAIVSSNIMLV